jgi:23S rRNA pseudouridine1911/1915/1917 synthase
MTEQQFRVSKTGAGMRIDRWLGTKISEFSRSKIKALINKGYITCDNEPVKEHKKTIAGQMVQVYLPVSETCEVKPEPVALNIIYEDKHLVAVNKPAGLVVHPAAGNYSGTLVNGLIFAFPEMKKAGNRERPGIVHRLDKFTSGVIVAAKTDAAYHNLVTQFKNRTIHKTYLALVHGIPSPVSGVIETEIGRHPTRRKKMSVSPKKGKKAVTDYAVLETFDKVSLIRAEPRTGRTHQIRVHLAYIGNPVIGDKVYGRKTANSLNSKIARQMLHALNLKLIHPVTGEPLNFTAPVPEDMNRLLMHFKGSKADTTL